MPVPSCFAVNSKKGKRVSYVTDGRFRASVERENALRLRDLARSYFRSGCPGLGRACMGRAIRAWRQFRYFQSKIGEPN
jgi:hypothetical protein